MCSLNQVSLIGHVGVKPVLKKKEAGASVTAMAAEPPSLTGHGVAAARHAMVA